MSEASADGSGERRTGSPGRHDPDGPSDILSLLTGPALFARARLARPGPFNHHLPLLFWLAGLIRPVRAVTLGAPDGIAHFAACQAIGHSDVGAVHGIADWPGGTPPQDLLDYQARHYPGLSVLSAADPAGAAASFPEGPIDLLIVDLPPAELAHLAGWADRLSPRGVALIHGTTSAGDVDALSRGCPAIGFPHGAGLTLIGSREMPEGPLGAILRWAGDPDALDPVRRAFRQLGLAQVAGIGPPDGDGTDPAPADRQAALRAEIDRREATIRDQARELALFAQALAEAQDEVRAADHQIAELERTLGEERGRADAYVTSTSWRLTAPLRFVVNGLRR